MKGTSLLFAAVLILSGQGAAAWHIETVDDVYGVGFTPAIAIGPGGHPGIAYGREGYGAKLAEYNGTYWEKETIYLPSYGNCAWFDLEYDSADTCHVAFGGSIGLTVYGVKPVSGEWDLTFIQRLSLWTSMCLNQQEYPYICVFSNDGLWFMEWSGILWVEYQVDPGSDCGDYNSMALGANDDVHISYCDLSEVKYAHRDQYGTWSVSTLENASGTPMGTSIAVDGQGHPHVSYNVSGDLRYAVWNGSSWEIETVWAVDTGAWQYGTSLALDTWDCPHIAHAAPDGSSLLYSVNHGSGWETESITLFTNDPDLVLDSSNAPHIAVHTGASLVHVFADSVGVETENSAMETAEISAWPNPFSGSLTISFDESWNEGETAVTVYDLQGRTIAQLIPGGSGTEVQWNPDDSVPDGQYIVVVRQAGETQFGRAVLLR